jgi:hypothetical protein
LSFTHILSLKEIEQGLNEQYRDAPPELAYLRLRPSNLVAVDFTSLERKLEVRFPKPFSDLIREYNFGDLALGGVFFGNTERYDDFLLRVNGKPEFPWWGSGVRPLNWLLVAGTDGFVILLDVTSGQVFAFSRASDWRTRELIACDFERFVRGAGTLVLVQKISDETTLHKQLCQFCGVDEGSRFWLTRLQGIE